MIKSISEGGENMDQIKEARKSARLTQSEVAQKLNITQGTYSQWENGKVRIDGASLQRLADLFGVSVDYLLGMTSDPKQKNPPRVTPPMSRSLIPLNGKLCPYFLLLAPKISSFFWT